MDFWYECNADSIVINENQITFKKNQFNYTYVIDENIPISAINLIESIDVNKLQHILGPNYNVWSMQDKLVVEFDNQVKVLKSQA